MDPVPAMEVGAEIEVTEDGLLEELPLRLENAKNCLSWEDLEVSSSDDDGETTAPTSLPPLRPPRPLAPNLLAPPFTTKSLPLENIIVPFRPGPAAAPGTQACGAYQCQECCQVFVEEWHYLQHAQEHAQELARRPRPVLPHSLPQRKQRCPECGKRFSHQPRFTRHVKWHLKLAQAGIWVQRRRGARPCSLTSYVYQPLGAGKNQAGSGDVPCPPPSWESSPGLRKQQGRAHPGRCVGQTKGRQMPEARTASKEQGTEGPKGTRQRRPTLGREFSLPRPVGMSPTQPMNMEDEGRAAILDSKVVMSPPQPMNGQVSGSVLQAAILDSQIGGSTFQAAILDGQVGGSPLRTLVINTEEQAAILESLLGGSPPPPAHLKEEAAILASLVGASPLHSFRTVVVGAEEPVAILEGQVGVSPLHPMPLRAEELPPSLFLEAEPGLSTAVDAVTLRLVPLLPDPQGLMPWGSQMVGELPDETGDAQPTAFQLTGYLPPLNQQCRPPGPLKLPPSPRAPLLLHLVPTHPDELPQVLELEYAPGSGLAPEAGDDFIVVELEADAGGREEVVAGQPGTAGPERSLDASRRRHFWCPDCGVCYGRAAQLRSHRRGPGRRLCGCGRPFRGLLHLLRHQLWQLEGAAFLCAACGEALKGRRALGRHGGRHPGASCFHCPCGVGFQRLPRYLWHRIRNQPPGLGVYSLDSFLTPA
uniref:C2H2-type domain-containing protein n=1 Tax=Gopherus agassizii TaxID=38772 RepID=A0A452HX50_9SAUR